MPNLLKHFFYFLIYLLKLPLFSISGSKVAIKAKVRFDTKIIRSSVGKFSYIGGGVYLVDTEVKNYCSIATGAKIGGMEHSWWWLSTSSYLSEYNICRKCTIIEEDVWIGANAVIRQGVKIGRGAVIGAGAIVLEDVSPFAIVAGVPARLIRMRFDENIISKIIDTHYWDFPPTIARQKLRTLSNEISLHIYRHL